MSTKLNIVNTFENSAKKPIIFLGLIGLAGLLLRLIYFPYDIPIKKGTENFEIIKYEYYKDRSIEREAFKSGEIDFF